MGSASHVLHSRRCLHTRNPCRAPWLIDAGQCGVLLRRGTDATCLHQALQHGTVPRLDYHVGCRALVGMCAKVRSVGVPHRVPLQALCGRLLPCHPLCMSSATRVVMCLRVVPIAAVAMAPAHVARAP